VHQFLLKQEQKTQRPKRTRRWSSHSHWHGSGRKKGDGARPWFGGDTDATAGEILRCREALAKLAEAATLAQAGASRTSANSGGLQAELRQKRRDAGDSWRQPRRVRSAYPFDLLRHAPFGVILPGPNAFI
jgi:hypothetical protein